MQANNGKGGQQVRIPCNGSAAACGHFTRTLQYQYSVARLQPRRFLCVTLARRYVPRVTQLTQAPPTVDKLTCPINQVSHNSGIPPQFLVVEERLGDIGTMAGRRTQRGLVVPVETGVGVVVRSACLQDRGLNNQRYRDQ